MQAVFRFWLIVLDFKDVKVLKVLKVLKDLNVLNLQPFIGYKEIALCFASESFQTRWASAQSWRFVRRAPQAC